MGTDPDIFGACGGERYEGRYCTKRRGREEVLVQAAGFILHHDFEGVGGSSGAGEERHICEKGGVDEGVLEPIVEIVKAAQERRYVDANDGYLRLSIGKAAWPIGVTMVGIHERSAREKLHESDKGHVMGDEVTRKFLQSIKRCLSFAQVRWPPEDIRQLMG